MSSLARIAETRRLGLLGLCAALLVACSQPAAAQTEPAPQVRRVFVPVDQVEQALESGDRFVAFSADRLRDLLGEHAPGAAPQGPVWCSRAVHRAEQAEDGRGLEGVSRLTLETYPQAATEPSAEGHLLVLGDTNLIIEAASWVNRPETTPRLGFWHPPEGGTPVLGLLVDEPGELELRWSLPPAPDVGGSESYRLRLPPSAHSQFELVLPKGDAPFLDGNPPEEASQDAGPSLDRWVFALSPDGRNELRIDPASPDAAETARLNWSRSTTYRLSPEGVFAEHRLLVAAGPRPGAARLRVRGDARLLQVTAPGQDEGARLIAPAGKSATVPLPEPDAPVEIVCRTVSSSLTADRLSGKDDQLWPLPTLQIENGDWTEGDATIEVPPTLRLLDIATTDAGLLETVPSDEGDNPGELFHLQEYAPGAIVEIAVRPTEQQIEVRAVSTVDLGSLDPVGVYSAEILSLAAPVYELVGRVPEDWQVESVQTVPADLLGAWSLDGPPENRSLRVSLANPLLHGESLRLLVGEGLRAESVLLPATSEELRLLQLLGTTRRQHALVLSRGDQQAWNVPREIAEAVIAPEAFQQRYGSLTDSPVRGVAFDLAALDPQQPIDLEPVPAEFSAEVVVEASYSPGACRCRHRIRITPESGSLASLRIRTTRPLPEEASWTIETGQASVRVTPSSSSTAAGSTQYRIALPSALAEPFDLVVESVSPRSGSCACIGVEVASAKQSGAWYVIRGDAPSLEIDPGRCLAVPPPVGLLSEATEGLPVVAAYRLPTYAPLESLSLPVVTTNAAPADDLPAPRPRLATAEYTLVQSADGAQLCTAEFRLEDRLAGEVEVSLPSGAAVRSAWQDGAEVDAEKTSGAGPVLRLMVDPLREETTFGVSFQTSGKPLGACSRVSVPPIETSFEVGEGRLRVWAPPGYKVVDPACEVGLRQRLLGPLSNTAGEFDDQPRNARMQGEAPPGWALYEDRFVGRPEPLTCRGREDAFAASWPVVFSVALIGGVLVGGRYRIGVAVVVLAAVAVVFAPAGWLAVAQPLFLGVTAAAVIQHLRSTPQEEETDDASGGSLPAKTLAVLVALFLITGQPSRAEDQATKMPNPIHTVIVPYTPGDAPADEVFISEGLLATLQQKQQLRAVDRFDYLVFRGEYRGSTEPDATWHLAWDVECRRPDGRILLPLKQDQAQWQEPFRAGGVEVNSQWLPSGEGLWLFLPGPGRYRVEAACVAPGVPDESPWRLDLSTPATPLARIELDGADTETTVNCEADGTPRRADDRGRVSFSIASHDRLRLGWSTPESDGLVNPIGPVDIFSWLRIDESAVRLDVLIGVRPKQPEGAVLRLRVPPELELEPADSTDAGADVPTRVRRWAGHPDELLVPLAEDGERLQQAPLRFRLRRRSSIGRVYPTPLEVVGAEPGRRWLGVSVAAGLSYQHDSNSPREEIRPEEFAAQWGEATPPPQFALAADLTASPWSIYVRPDPAGYSGDQDTRVVIDRQGAEVLFNANVDEVAGSWSMHRLLIPPKLEVASVEVVEQGSESNVGVTWSRPRDNRITLFLDRPLTAPHTVTVTGRVPHQQDRCAVPVVEMLASSGGLHTLRVLHTRTTQIEMPETSPWQSPFEDEWAGAPIGLVQGGRAAWRGPAPSDLGTIAVEPNAPVYSVQSLTTIVGTGDPRPVSLDAVVTVEDGVLHHLVLSLPKSWEGVSLDSATPMGTLSDDGQGSLLLHLRQPLMVGDTLALKLRALAPIAPEEEGMPEVAFPGARSAERYMRLTGDAPSEMPEGPASPAVVDLPPELRELAEPLTTSVILRQPDRRTAPTRPTQEASPVLGPIMVEGTLDGRGRFSGEAQLMISAGPSQRVTLALPAGASVSAVQVGGTTVPTESVVGGEITLTLGPPHLPRVVSLRYSTPVAIQGKTATLSAPGVIAEGRRLTPSEVGWNLSTTGYVTIDTTLLATLPGTEPLQQRWLAAWAMAAQTEASDPVLLAAERRAWLREPRVPAHSGVEAEDPAEGQGPPVRFISTESQTSIELSRPRSASVAGGMGFVLLLLAVLWLEQRQGLLRRWVLRFRWQSCALAGLAWWWLLRPGLPGLLLTGSVLLLAAYSLWANREPRPVTTFHDSSGTFHID